MPFLGAKEELNNYTSKQLNKTKKFKRERERDVEKEEIKE